MSCILFDRDPLRIFRKCSVATLLQLMLISLALADECSEKLLDRDVELTITSDNHRAFARDIMCSLNYSEINNTYGGKASIIYGAAGGEGQYNQSSYENKKENKKQELCSDITKEGANSSLSFHSKSIISTERSRDYLQCKLKQPISCTASQEAAGVIIVQVNWKSLYEGGGIVQKPFVSNGEPDVKDNDTIPKGDSSVGIRNVDRNSDFIFKMDVVQQGVSYRCFVQILAPPVASHIGALSKYWRRPLPPPSTIG